MNCRGAVETQQGSASVREENILRWVGGGWWAVNLSSTCSLDSGAWCEVSSGRYPIDHIYYIHHSASLFWQLIAPGKEKGRIGFLFKRRGILWAWALSLLFFFFSARGLQREISHWCWLRVPVRNHNSCRMIFGMQLWKVSERNNFDGKKKEILMAHQFSALWQSGCAVEVCPGYWKNNLCFYFCDWFLFNNVKEKHVENQIVWIRNVYPAKKNCRKDFWSGHKLNSQPQ